MELQYLPFPAFVESPNQHSTENEDENNAREHF